MSDDPDRSDELRDWYAEDDPDGTELLDDVLATLKSYVIFANEHQAIAVALWIAATHAIAAWQHATRLIISSPQKRCGKSRLMDIVAGMVYSAMLCADATTAAIFRSIGEDDTQTPTLMVDEADALWGTKRAAENNEDLRALFNAGWQRNRPAKRCVGPHQIPTDFNTFAMAAFAAIGRLPDTITDRAANIDLKRRGPGEKVSRFRLRRDAPKLATLRDRLTTWVRDADRINKLADTEPDMPTGVEDRAADAWEPLVAIADAAGGQWPKMARRACRALSQSADDADDDLGTLLLGDIRQVFTDAHESFLTSNVLVRELRAIEESPWGDDELTASKLAKQLKSFGVKPGHNAAKTVRGYSLNAFRDAFTRYLRPNPSGRPKQDADQHEQAETAETHIRLDPSEGVRTDGSGRVTDTSDITKKTPEHTGHSDVSDDRTVTDGTPARIGTPLRQCPCGRPAPVNPETGLCHWCSLKASKQQSGATE